ncbi:FAD binding domain-containing protein [Xylariaceae sp. FL0662B]|nr:FAD binding domain-containing protein [Xylariaceae sp. FL0662B]
MVNSTTDVLIVGGGPTGLTLALELAVHKIPFRIVDKATQRSPHSRAMVIQPRTFELLNRHGDVRQLRARGSVAEGTSICINGKEVAYLDTAAIKLTGTAFGMMTIVSQCETERWLDATLAKHGSVVEMGVEAKNIAQDADGVTVHLARGDGAEEVVRAKYVVGADGAHSCVRHAATNLTFEGAAYDQEFILTDARIESSTIAKNRAYMCFGQGVMIVIPLRDGGVRVVASRPGREDPKLEDIEGFMREVLPGGGSLHDPVWLTGFRLHHRGVNSYRDGRLFVAGDAAHIHSPAGGQGMNTGIQDAVNLGWKLAAVLRGARPRPDAFLDSYDAERRPVGQHLLRTSDRTFSLEATTNPVARFLRNLVLPWVLPYFTSNSSAVTGVFGAMSQLRIRYRRSDLVGTAPGFTGPIKGGDRAVDGRIRGPEGGEKRFQELLTPECHHLVLFSGLGSAAASGDDLHHAQVKFLEESGIDAKIHTIFSEGRNGQSGFLDLEDTLHKVYGLDSAGYILVRPDSYIAHIGPLSALDGVISWVRR